MFKTLVPLVSGLEIIKTDAMRTFPNLYIKKSPMVSRIHQKITEVSYS